MAEQRGSQPGQLRVGDRAEVEPDHMTRMPLPQEASENYAGGDLVCIWECHLCRQFPTKVGAYAAVNDGLCP
jgi:hypothetical protein